MNNKTSLHPFIHVIGWTILIGSNLFFESRDGHFVPGIEYFVKLLIPIFFMIVFYANYCYLIEKMLFAKRMRQFLFTNMILIVVLGIAMHFCIGYVNSMGADSHHLFPIREGRRYMDLLFISRNFFSLALSTALSVAIRMTFRWSQVENERRDLEKSKSEAELKNLKNQLNPHFLLNTLNNIYALIALSPERAQLVVLDLSKLLRYVLYENNKSFVPLEKEIEFLDNYIKLMRIRISETVAIDIHLAVKEHSETQVAPLLFISLVENAFKHGVSYTHPSYIKIFIQEDEEKVVCDVENSSFPKKDNDKSGSGIGLDYLQRRLNMVYPNQHEWKIEESEGKYRSTLILYLHQKR